MVVSLVLALVSHLVLVSVCCCLVCGGVHWWRALGSTLVGPGMFSLPWLLHHLSVSHSVNQINKCALSKCTTGQWKHIIHRLKYNHQDQCYSVLYAILLVESTRTSLSKSKANNHGSYSHSKTISRTLAHDGKSQIHNFQIQRQSLVSFFCF